MHKFNNAELGVNNGAMVKEFGEKMEENNMTKKAFYSVGESSPTREEVPGPVKGSMVKHVEDVILPVINKTVKFP